MINKDKRRNKMLRKVCKGALRISVANGSNFKKNSTMITYGLDTVSSVLMFEELKIDINFLLSKTQRIKHNKERDEISQKFYKMPFKEYLKQRRTYFFFGRIKKMETK